MVSVSDYYLRYEFAKSRGMIHFHMLVWRQDSRPHGIFQESLKDPGGEGDITSVLAEWFSEIGMTATHPGPNGENDWPPPEGTKTSPTDADALCKVYSDFPTEKDRILNYVDTVN